MARPKGSKYDKLVQLRISEEMGNDLDKYRRNEPDLPSRSEAIRRILQDWLEQHSFIDTTDGQEHEE